MVKSREQIELERFGTELAQLVDATVNANLAGLARPDYGFHVGMSATVACVGAIVRFMCEKSEGAITCDEAAKAVLLTLNAVLFPDSVKDLEAELNEITKGELFKSVRSTSKLN